MTKTQKAIAVLSIITITALGLLVGLFVWQESGRTKLASQEQSKRQELANASGNSKTEGAETEERDGTATGQQDGSQGSNGSNKEAGPSEEEPESYEDELAAAQDPEESEQGGVAGAKDVTMVFTGDIYLSQYVLNNYDASGIGGVVSEGLLDRLKNADFAMANEEFPFSTNGTPEEDKQFTFRVDPSYTSVLQDMGLDLVTLANNHALDYGTEALTDTFSALNEAKLPYVGAGASKEEAARPFYAEAGGKKIGFLAASRVIPNVEWNIDNRQPGLFCTYDSTELNDAIRSTKAECDFVVVYIHWGIERENTPEEYQRTLAKGYIDAGADLVIGAHPHVLQGIEYYQGKPIVYSLGNFIFNQEIPSTMMLEATLTADGETKLTVLPASASGAYTMELEGEEAAELYSFLEEISFSVMVDESGTVFPAN